VRLPTVAVVLSISRENCGLLLSLRFRCNGYSQNRSMQMLQVGK